MEYLILAIIGFIAAITPGPDILYVIREGLCNDRRTAFLAVFGILTGNIIYLSLVGIGVGAIGKNSIFQAVVGIIGGLYLLKIAYLIFHDKPTINKNCSIKKGFEVYKEALFLNLSNPKAMLFFTIIVTPFIAKSIILSLISLFIAIALAFIITAFFSSIIEINTKTMEIINKISTVIFLFFSFSLFKVAYDAINNLL